MKKLYIMALIFALQACSDPAEPPAEQSQAATANVFSGVITEIIEVDNYTYLQIKSELGVAWIATSLVWVNEGDVVSFPSGVLMEDFHSSTLDRTFKSIMFVENINVIESTGGQKPALDPAITNPVSQQNAEASTAPAETVQTKPEAGSMTVAEIFEAYPDIDGQVVSLQGTVLKFSPNIMGSNWVTLKDGTGTAPENVLVVKTQETIGIGDVVVVSGTVKIDVSLGYGYDYKILLEDASISAGL